MSTYKGIDLFGSGPHRLAEGKRGQALLPELFETPPGPGTRYLGLVELEVVVTGRLVAASDEALFDLVDAVSAQVIDPPAPGTLASGGKRSWEDMSFVSFAPADRVDRGRGVSLGYVARFLKFRQYPQG